MKKIKFMLLSLALFAIVGAALAFKAKFDTFYCTSPTIQLPNGNFTFSTYCTNLAFSKANAAGAFFGTTDPFIDGSNNPTCFDPNQSITSLQCIDTQRLIADGNPH